MKHSDLRSSFLVAVTLAGACSADDGAPAGADATIADGGLDASACPRSPAAADRPRAVIVSLPYDADGRPASVWGRWTLGVDGSLTDTGQRFTMGRAFAGRVAFTPDGQLGLVAQDDGTVGVFRIDDAGVTVVHERFEGSFYAGSVVLAPDGGSAWIVDPNWPGNGGGVYRVDLGCDGTLTDRGLWFPAKLAAALHLHGTRAIVPAAEVGAASPAGHDVHVLDWRQGPPVRVGGVDAFGDDDAIIGGSAVTDDGAHALLGDNSEFSGRPNRIAVVSVGGAAVAATTVLTPIEDPVAIVASPFDDAALIVSGYGDAFFALDYTPGAANPFTRLRELTYTGRRPQLPGDAVRVDRGALRGLVVVAEVGGLRRVRFTGNRTVSDLGVTATGAGVEALPGALGVQP